MSENYQIHSTTWFSGKSVTNRIQRIFQHLCPISEIFRYCRMKTENSGLSRPAGTTIQSHKAGKTSNRRQTSSGRTGQPGICQVVRLVQCPDGPLRQTTYPVNRGRVEKKARNKVTEEEERDGGEGP